MGIIKKFRIKSFKSNKPLVSFDKILKTLPGFKCNWSVEKGIIDLLGNLRNVNLDKDVFNRREFYRLQQIEYLYKTKQIDNDLLWSK